MTTWNHHALRTVTVAFGLLLHACFTGCAAAPASSRPAAAPAETTPPRVKDDCPPIPYVKVADPLFLAYDNTANVYERVTLAQLWLLVAKAEPQSEARDARTREATRSLKESSQAVQTQTDPCAAGVVQALRRAELTKNNIEQRYLQVSQNAGEDSDEARLLDAQVHLMRDRIVALGTSAEPCRSQRMFR